MGEKQEAAAEKKNEGSDKKGAGDGKKEGGGGGDTIVLKIDLHCEGCAKKVKRSVKHIPGVESVKADFATNELTVVGNVDPAQIRDKLADKTKKNVDLISPQPAKKDNKENKENKENGSGDKKQEGKKEEKKPKEPQVTTAVMKTRVHCEGCANKIKKILRKYDGVQDANVELSKDQITVKGTMDMKELLPYMNTKLKRPVELAPSASKKEGGGGGGGGDDKKSKGGEGENKKKDNNKEGGGGGGDKKKDGGGENKKGGGGGGGGDDKKKEKGGGSNDTKAKSIAVEDNNGGPKIEMNASPYAFGGYGMPPPQMYAYPNQYSGQASSSGYVTEHWHNAPRQPYYNMQAPPMAMQPDYYNMQAPPMAMQPDYYNMHAPPPQMFSDENPNACSVM